ncbi:hypothetical protein WOLCODRAFT_106363 [Wolfiporia cocos MD-104 SS10]|uniref:F-box domain-containing protein n=1 Tax=Wolfiporia cocos (strain MD-104) TaxID=742152 RepID=A0A2H3J7G1_WOLCO|nr:hypothetical protein WOLCODRAFT_106363 [Wolfiporia cocos MD-104 SS10]
MSVHYPTRPILPVEVLDCIAQKLPPGNILGFIRANTHLHAVGVRALYRDIPELPAARIVACLKTLATCPAYAILVRSLFINWTGCQVVGNLLRLLRRALAQLRNLQELTVDLCMADSKLSGAWIYSSIGLCLRRFSTSALCDAPLSRFLETQHHLEELTLRGSEYLGLYRGAQRMEPFALSPFALPRLHCFRTVSVRSPLLAQVLKDRPVVSVTLSLMPGDGFTSLDALTLSCGPVERLTIMSMDCINPVDTLLEIATRLPRLQMLHLVVLLAQFDHQILSECTCALSHFSELQHITVVSGTGGALSDEHDIATCWHKCCPTLNTIILPKGQVWYQQDNKWICDTT